MLDVSVAHGGKWTRDERRLNSYGVCWTMPYIHVDMRVLSHVQPAARACCMSIFFRSRTIIITIIPYHQMHHSPTHLQVSPPLLSSSFRPSARQHVPLFHHPSHFTCALGTTDALELALFACPQSPWCIIRSLLSAIIDHQSTTHWHRYRNSAHPQTPPPPTP